MITQSELKSRLHYNPMTGDFTWLIASSRAKKGRCAGTLSHGYISIGIDGCLYSAHRLVFLYMTGKQPENEVDHINHIRSDNRWVNLRLASRIDNNMNKSLRADNTSGTPGVAWQKSRRKWHAKINVNGVFHFLGRFTDKKDAINARKQAEKKYGFHPNHGAINHDRPSRVA